MPHIRALCHASMNQDVINALRHQRVPDQGLLIDGRWVSAAEEQRLRVVSPIDGQTICTLASAEACDVDRAVTSARNAFECGAWSRIAPVERKKIMHRIADLMHLSVAPGRA